MVYAEILRNEFADVEPMSAVSRTFAGRILNSMLSK
jgi:hypothetical protein